MQRDRFGFTPEDHYDTLDAMFTQIIHEADVDVGPEVLKLLIAYNRRLRVALGLPVDVAN